MKNFKDYLIIAILLLILICITIVPILTRKKFDGYNEKMRIEKQKETEKIK